MKSETISDNRKYKGDEIQPSELANSVAQPSTKTKNLFRGRDYSLSVMKASYLLKLVGDSENGITLTELANASKLGITVCNRMLVTLQQERLLDKDSLTGRYRLGLGILALAYKAQSLHPLVAYTADLVDNIVRHTGDIVLLMVRDGDEVVCINRKEGSFHLKSSGTQVGTRLPMHCGGGPLALLAFSPDSYVDQYLTTKVLEKRTMRTRTDPKLIKTEIAKVRKRGYTISNQDLFDYVVAIGVPLFNSAGVFVGSLSVGGVAQRYDNKRIKEVGEWLVEAAQQYSIGRS